jgi:hypothetical protein
MKIKLLRNIGIEGKIYQTGEVVEVNRTFGLQLISAKRAEAVTVEGDPEPEPATGGVISTENGVAPFPEGEPEPAKPTPKNGRGK